MPGGLYILATWQRFQAKIPAHQKNRKLNEFPHKCEIDETSKTTIALTGRQYTGINIGMAGSDNI